ncbi:hypothetical protein OIU77_013041 [Salix suchowensis]|uniref:Uncharacterized protein n=1 Tax=Salix suchowensis TaxID=1278906 RepID=A0ABQ8ZU26_9ROSI|nr:hypothetical protein OIU77_013041 [Salix suchowensis]
MIVFVVFGCWESREKERKKVVEGYYFGSLATKNSVFLCSLFEACVCFISRRRT